MKVKFLLLLILVAYIVYFVFFAETEVKEVEMYLTVENIYGFNVNDSIIYFGAMPPGAIGTKEFNITNDIIIPKFVHISSRGNLSQWIRVSDNNFLLLGNEKKVMNVKAFVPRDAKYGDYEGILRMEFKKII